ncbi:toprim domain-containing protein [Bengtsoniella intestinalis]|uniref:DUF3991 domain-containing protein n=1 Tax=Bengtsoniella intestinalis TaxID=3073143 RepID=UPI00391F99B5
MHDKFTEQEMTIAKDTDLPDLIASLGYHVKPIGRYHTLAEMDSIRIKNRRTWKRYSEGVGGDAITFLQHFQNMTFPDAVRYLLGFNGHARDSPLLPRVSPNVPTKEPPKPFTLPERNADHRRVFAYLRKRGIAPQVIRGFLEAGLLYESHPHHNCVFVGRDGAGEPSFATQRGTYDMGKKAFRGDVSGSDKTVAFPLGSAPDNPTLFVFEAPIDLMSYLTLNRHITSNALALCGLYDGALERYLKEHPHIKHITLCLDADHWGRKTVGELTAKYEGLGYTVDSQEPAHGKDWNEWLQKQHKPQERGR